MRYSFTLWMVISAAMLVGCTTLLDRRIAADQGAWDALSPSDHQRLSQGHVRRGDTEAMARLALGPPDQMLQLSGRDGRRLTVWIYEEISDNGGDPLSPTYSPQLVSREQSLVFDQGEVVDRAALAIPDSAKLLEIRARPAAKHMLARLDALVALDAGQKIQAYVIFAKAREELLAFSPQERPEKGRQVRVRMRTEIRSLLTPGQQLKYDDAPGSLGGGSTLPLRTQPSPENPGV